MNDFVFKIGDRIEFICSLECRNGQCEDCDAALFQRRVRSQSLGGTPRRSPRSNYTQRWDPPSGMHRSSRTLLLYLNSSKVQHGKNGYLTDYGDTAAVARHLYDLWTDQALYARLSKDAGESVSDEVGTVGNALCWLYLAVTFARGENVKPNGAWIIDLARMAAGEPYVAGESRLQRPDLHVQA